MTKTNDFHKSQSGIMVPTSALPVGVECAFCDYVIFKQNEAGGRLYLHQGKPICARCRILKGSKYANIIRQDVDVYEKDILAKKHHAEAKEIQRVAEIAVASQKNTEHVGETGLEQRRKFQL